MDLFLNRKDNYENDCEGAITLKDVQLCVTLEPTDRGLTGDMTLAQIAAIKVEDATAIPTGRWQIKKYHSPTKGWVLILINVPGFDYVEIHIGNTHKDTHACICPGEIITGNDFVSQSKIAVDALYAKLFPVLDSGEQVWLTVARDYQKIAA